MGKKEIPVMDKLIRNIIIGVVVVLLLVAGYVALSIIPGQIEERNLEELEGETGKVLIMSSSVDYVETVEVTNENGRYTLLRDETGTWGVKEYPGVPVESVSIESAVYGFVNLYALEEIEMPENLSDYGFDNPRAKITISMKDGTKREFALGNKVTGGRGDFFLDSVNNKSYVVSIYMSDSMLKTPESYRKAKLASVTADDVASLIITNSNGKIVIGMEESNYSSEPVLVMTHPKHMNLDETLATSILETIQDISVVKYVEDGPSDLAKYGLLNPSVQVEIGTKDANYKLSFGDKTDTGTVYTMLDGMDFVFTFDPSMYDECVNVTAYNLMNKFVNIVNISEVKSITVEGKGKYHKLEIKGGDDFYIDGSAALAESFRKTYQSIIGIKGSGLAVNSIVSPVEYTVVFEYNNGETTNIEYASYDDMNYYVETDGERGFITLKKGLDDMMETVEKLAKNPMKKMN